MPRNALLMKLMMAVITMESVTLAWAMTISAESNTADQQTSTDLFAVPTHLNEEELHTKYAKFLLANMNETVDACADFYEYACGNWKQDDLIPQQSRNNSFIHAIGNQIQQLIENYLKNATDAELLADTAEGKAKQFFKSCVKDKKDMAKGFKLLWEENTAESPNATDWIDINFASKYGMNPLLPLKLHYSRETRKLELMLKAPSKLLDNSNIVDIKNLTRDFKLDNEALLKQFNSEFEQMKMFEVNLTASVTQSNGTSTATLKDFLAQHKHDKLNWTRYFELAFNGSAKSEWLIHNTIEDYIELARFLQHSQLSTMRTYIKWYTLIKFYLTWNLEMVNKTVETMCRAHTQEYFKYSLMPWFIDTAFDADRRADILAIAQPIKRVFYDFIERQNWLDETTKSHAKTKLRAMDIEVGYTDNMRQHNTINQAYNSINMTDNWYENLAILEAHRAKTRLKYADASYIPWLPPHDANAYYASFLNLVYIAAGIAQMPLYHIKLPAALKFGGIGNIIGHEMSHAFDVTNYHYNYDGKFQHWWSNSSLLNFQERYHCLESQYNKFIFYSVQVNGTLTLNDNIADNVGARLAYNAYMQQYGKRDGNKHPFIELPFNNKQLFFLKFAQNWCSGKSNAEQLAKMKTDEHALERYRVIGTLSNMPEFSEAFQCKLGTHMNPLKKCVIW